MLLFLQLILGVIFNYLLKWYLLGLRSSQIASNSVINNYDQSDAWLFEFKRSTMKIDFGSRLEGVTWFKNGLFYLGFPISTPFQAKSKRNDICRMLTWLGIVVNSLIL